MTRTAARAGATNAKATGTPAAFAAPAGPGSPAAPGASAPTADVDEVLTLPAVELAARMRRRELSPVEVVEAHVARIEAVNPHLNAVVAERFEAARAEAREAEARLAAAAESGEAPPPLCGVPCTMKEFFAVDGMPNTGGFASRRGVTARGDATLVARLRAAGAIVLGMTNVPEGGMWPDTYNRVYGRTRNPWNLARTPGGSSGGEAAIIAAGGSPFGIGSDIGGSIRYPAAMCGVVGHKPSGRLVPNTGHYPPAEGELGAYMVSGPIARRTADLMPILRAIAGPDGADPVARPFVLGEPAEVDLGKVTVFPLETNGRTRVGRVMRAEVARAARALEARGARVESAEALPARRLRHAFSIWAALVAEAAGEVMSYAHLLGDGTPISWPREMLRWATGRGRHTFPALMVTATEGLARLTPRRQARMAAAGRALRDELESALGPTGVLLHPPYSRPAPRPAGLFATPFDIVCTALFNVLEFPGTAVPTGFDAAGLPLGVQVLARRGADTLTIAVAAALEDEFGGWRAPATPAP